MSIGNVRKRNVICVFHVSPGEFYSLHRILFGSIVALAEKEEKRDSYNHWNTKLKKKNVNIGSSAHGLEHVMTALGDGVSVSLADAG